MMALPVIEHNDYSAYGGKGVWDIAQTSLPAAVAAVREIIGFNVPDDDEQVEAYKRAVVAAINVDMAYGQSAGIGEGLNSLKIGTFSASMTTQNGTSSYDADMHRAIRRELSGSGLLYQGVGGA